jgi:hypothetical protein
MPSNEGVTQGRKLGICTATKWRGAFARAAEIGRGNSPIHGIFLRLTSSESSLIETPPMDFETATPSIVWPQGVVRCLIAARSSAARPEQF